MLNIDIKQAAKQAKVKHYMIAAELNIRDTEFSYKLRFPLPEEERNKILKIIEKLSQK
ncbi:MAG: hypothetical protein FWF92_07680 [Oscillospiraceae bacterium]|nr:hypothetical protein [Oscillospiraceae bacterium]